MKKKKHAGGREPLSKEKKKFRITVFVSPEEIGQDNGVKQYLKAMNKELDKQLKK